MRCCHPARLAIVLGLGWSLAFALLGPAANLHEFADGGLFAYAVAAQDSWAFHFHNIPGRAAVWLLVLLPAETWGALAANPASGARLYGVLHFALPLAGLALTWAADRSPGRALFPVACAATAVLLPFVFGFPTEMWATHALFWPALALALTAPPGPLWTAALALLLAALLTTHEAALVWAGTALAILAMARREPWRARRAALAGLPGLAAWAALTALGRPDPYVRDALGRNALQLFSPASLLSPVLLLALLALAGFAALFLALSRRLPPCRAAVIAVAATAAALAAWWAGPDTALHGEARYALRGVLLGAVPAFALLAMVLAGAAPAWADRALPVLRHRTTACLAAGALLVLSLAHAVETAKFVTAWHAYQHAVATLANGTDADPDLGDPAFVDAARLDPGFAPLVWDSTTPYLGILRSPGLAPARLVVDTQGWYAWISCEAATANEHARRDLPAATRRLVRIHACLNR